MESQQLDKTETLVSTQSYNPVLATTIWLLSGVLILCIIIRLSPRLKSRLCYHSIMMDDMLVVAGSLTALASMFTMSTTVNLGFKAQNHSTSKAVNSEIQIKIYISTVLFVITISLSKMPLILWLRQLKLRAVYRTCTIIMGCKVIACMIALTTSVIFQCKLPRPWDIQAGRCISLQAFWTVAITIDIVLDLALTILSVLGVMSMNVQQKSENWAASVLFLRTVLIVPSLMRLVYLQQSISDSPYPVLPSQSYTIATQCQVTLAVVLSCTLALPRLAFLVKPPLNEASVALRKHWSGTTISINGSIDYSLSGPVVLIKEPLPDIQASMSIPPGSPHGSTVSLPSPTARAYSKIPIRPPPPSEHERPDLEMFTQRPIVKKPPIVTLLDNRIENTLCGTTLKPFYRERGQASISKHVKFGI